MKVIDSATGVILETNNPLVVEQFKKNPQKYKEIKPKSVKPKN